MGRAASPTLRQRRLATKLREIRLAAGLKIEDVAAQVMISTTHLSRMETAARRATPRNVRSLCDFYGIAPDLREELMQLARDSTESSWWQTYELPDTMAIYVGLEDSAVSIHQYETSLVPALLQTEAYAHAITAGTTLDIPADQVERRVRARLARQARLTAEQPPELSAIIDEGALHRQVGGPAVLREQLEALQESSRLPNVVLQVLSFEAGPHLGMNSTFIHLGFDDDSVPDCVYVEGFLGRVYLQKRDDLVRYRRAFDHLRAVALSPRDSQRRLATISAGLPA